MEILQNFDHAHALELCTLGDLALGDLALGDLDGCAKRGEAGQ
jgi:hypothetical protein